MTKAKTTKKQAKKTATKKTTAKKTAVKKPAAKKKSFTEKLKAELSEKSNSKHINKMVNSAKVDLFGKDGAALVRKRFRNKFSTPIEVPINTIKLKPEIFQGRSVPFASETVEKIMYEGFDKSQDPIIVFKDKDANIVISGHSRFEAANRLYKKGNKNLTKIPVKFFQGDKEEAIDYALIESNRSGKSEGIESDIKAYARCKQRGWAKQQLLNIFKSDSYLEALRHLSRLDPRGLFVEQLSKPESGSGKHLPYLFRNAVWVGELKNKYNDKDSNNLITNTHEEELFNFFYKTDKGLKIKKQALWDLIKKKVESPYFDPKKALKLNKETEFDVIKEKDPGFVKYKQIQASLENWNEERFKKEELAVMQKIKGISNSETKKKIIEISGAIERKMEEYVKLKENLRKEDNRLQTTGLF